MNDPQTLTKCPNCRGLGHIHTEQDELDDCEVCNGTGEAFPMEVKHFEQDEEESYREDMRDD